MASTEPDVVDVSMDDEDVATLLGENLVNTILEGGSLDSIKKLLEDGAPVWYQNEAEGTSPLHAAAYMRNPQLAKLLIEKGAVWNAVDYLKNTAGDISLSFNDSETYILIRDAGIRAELLLGILSSQNKNKAHDQLPSTASNLVLKQDDDTAAGSTDAFLSSKLTYTTDKYGQKVCMVKVRTEEGVEEEVGVMMGWEEGIMEETVRRLAGDHPNNENLTILNVGFGLGIIDTLFQSLPHPPAQHVIIEPHPDVLQHMRETGWYAKPNVTILEGKWQDFVANQKLLSFGGFDIVYTDTFSEDYSALKSFFEELPDILSGPNARFSFFHGLGATNALFYDVYTHISEMHLANIGLDVEWSDVDVTIADEDRWGKSREYFTLPTHCTCVYYQDWHRTRRPKPATEAGLLPAVCQAVSANGLDNAQGGAAGGAPSSTPKFSSPRNTLSSSTGTVVAIGESSSFNPPPPSQALANANITSTGLAFDEEAKLVYGVVLSLRHMIKKISGREEQFTSYRTSAYRLHLFETASGYKFVMLTDPKTEGMRAQLKRIYEGPFLEFVVRNPLVKMDSREQGVDNDNFRAALDRLVRGLPVFL